MVVTPANDPPFVTNEIEAIIIDEDFTDNIEINLNEHFDDPDEDELTYSVVIDNDIVNIEVEENILSIFASGNMNGITDIIITADDNANRQTRDICEISFSLTINAINDFPEIISFFPEELSFEIIDEREINFEVFAEDIDSEINYVWFVNSEKA